LEGYNNVGEQAVAFVKGMKDDKWELTWVAKSVYVFFDLSILKKQEMITLLNLFSLAKPSRQL
jgi:hypothetical protein